MHDPNDLISVYRGANVTEAYLVKNLLGEEGIEAQVTETNEPFAGLSITPPDVLVKFKDQARAEAIIADYDNRQIDRVEQGDSEDDDALDEN